MNNEFDGLSVATRPTISHSKRLTANSIDRHAFRRSWQSVSDGFDRDMLWRIPVTGCGRYSLKRQAADSAAISGVAQRLLSKIRAARRLAIWQGLEAGVATTAT
jgi:hypothetical protein